MGGLIKRLVEWTGHCAFKIAADALYLERVILLVVRMQCLVQQTQTVNFNSMTLAIILQCKFDMCNWLPATTSRHSGPANYPLNIFPGINSLESFRAQ